MDLESLGEKSKINDTISSFYFNSILAHLDYRFFLFHNISSKQVF